MVDRTEIMHCKGSPGANRSQTYTLEYNCKVIGEAKQS